MIKPSNRKQQILDIANRLIQTKSFTGFSFQEIADELGISKTAIHSHYRTKETLGNALLDYYFEQTISAHRIAEKGVTVWKKFDNYIAELVAVTLAKNQICTTTILQAEYNLIPNSMQQGVNKILQEDRQWLAHLLQQGLDDGSMQFQGSVQNQALFILTTLQGALIIGRADGIAEFDVVINQLKIMIAAHS